VGERECGREERGEEGEESEREEKIGGEVRIDQ
jgi:hypothetical protein